MSLVDIMSQIYGFILKTGQKFCNFALTMKKKTLITGLAAGFCFAAMMTGCDQQGASGPRSYTVTCSLDGQMKRDSATLLVLEEDYHKLRVCGTARAPLTSSPTHGERPAAPRTGTTCALSIIATPS